VKLKRRFLYLRSFDIAGYDDQSWYGGLSFRMLDDEPVQAAFDRFAQRVLSGIESRQFVPVYRMADGELQFITGKLAEVRTVAAGAKGDAGSAAAGAARAAGGAIPHVLGSDTISGSGRPRRPAARQHPHDCGARSSRAVFCRARRRMERRVFRARV
jgi:hypothetical protein